MPFDGPNDQTIAGTLMTTRRIAVVGASMRPYRPSHGVVGSCSRAGTIVVPVNVGIAGHEIRRHLAVPTLDDATPLEMADISRNRTHAGSMEDAAIRLGAGVVWMQLGVIDDAAAGADRRRGFVS